MLDIVLLVILTYVNSKNARNKGYTGYNYGWMTVGLWMGSEIVMFLIGALISNFNFTITLFFGIFGAAIGGTSSYLIVKNLKPREGFTPPDDNPYGRNDSWTYMQGSQANADYPWQPHGQSTFKHFVPEYKKCQGTGVCDVCGANISDAEGFLVPTDIFYTSQKYKDWLIQNPVTQAGVQSLGGPDKYLAYMRSRDKTQYSVICPSCIDLFK